MSVDLKSPESDPIDPAVRAVLATTSPADFDGHTEFHRLTPRERLLWMESALSLIERNRSRRGPGEKDDVSLPRG